MHVLTYRISDGIVISVADVPERVAELQNHGDPSLSVALSPPSEIVADGLWRWNGTSFVHDEAPAPSSNELACYANNKLIGLQGAVRTYTSGTTSIKSDALTNTLADWLALQQWASSNPAASTTWIANDSTVTDLPATAVNDIATAVGVYAQSVWQALSTMLGLIAAGSITTTAQIDAASWPT